MFSVYDSPPATGGRVNDGGAPTPAASAAPLAADADNDAMTGAHGGGGGTPPSAGRRPAKQARRGEPPPSSATPGAETNARIAALLREVAALRRMAVDGAASSLADVRSAYDAQLAAAQRVAAEARAEAATLWELVGDRGGGGSGGRGGGGLRGARRAPVAEPEEPDEVAALGSDSGGDGGGSGNGDTDVGSEPPRPTVLVEEVVEEEAVEVDVLPDASGAAGAALAAARAEAAGLRRELADAKAALEAASAGMDVEPPAAKPPAAAAAAGPADDDAGPAAALEVLAALVGARPVREPVADANDGGPPVWRLEVANGRGGERERRVAFRLGVPRSITSGAAGGGGGAPRPPRPTPDDGGAAAEEEELLEYDAVEVAVPPGVLPAYVKETAIDMPVEDAPYLFAKIVAAVFSASTRA
ncbi:hypothetical protein BU14_0116s0032 [Porphyra umbilicalis]|uniref:Uncharacterized protein n=1 Tax=Porphyra umbilicalis TaxID=2786 RepID=A0A1X6PBH5_PORUM|nr:hypothetical protein BU14_0116s0032 [Porphyra umbilicalis]|eukprot:OSX78212.1 hypothetical protein BU14_0116s0032 [Porphyra umbilicalis]